MRNSSFHLYSLRIAATAAACASLAGCFTNSGSKAPTPKASSTGSNSNTGTGTTTTPTSGDQFKIANVIVSTSGSKLTTAVYFDPSKSVPAAGSSGVPYVSNHCSNPPQGGGTSAKPCTCHFAWTEVSSSGGTTVSYARSVDTTVSNAQQSLINCPAPDVYTNEITDGTAIKLTVLAASGNPDSFTIPTFTFTKNSSNSVGSFKDAEGHSFDNVMHYACYERSNRGGSITSKSTTRTNPINGSTVSVPLANKLCVTKPGATPPAGCDNATPAKPSVQSYYYNFFIRASEAGDVNQWNDGFSCPTVKESLYGSSSPSGQNNFWPMDTNFALSIGKTPDFNVGVDAYVELANGANDPVSAAAKSCAGGAVPAGNSSTNGFVLGCLGFAAKPNTDGSCPYFRDANNQIRFTYRLRRYTAIYPSAFQVGGQPTNASQATDTIYVLDRPVTPPAGSDPLKPFAMRGPKPCNFAYFDANAVATATSSYVATNNVNWNGKNLDGIRFPNADTPNSCASLIPLVSPDQTTISLATSYPTNPTVRLQRLYIRPVSPWSPHYEEDTEFKACAPQSSVLRDPPLHFAKNAAGNIAWCSESYPSQNDHIPSLDIPAVATLPASAANPYSGAIIPYTSHLTKNSSSLACKATVPATTPTNGSYPAGAAGAANHFVAAQGDNLTCDRTATNSNGWNQFPLLAPATDVERMLVSDDSYTCAVTYDGGGAKSAGKLTPAEGCCSTSVAAAVRTGIVVPNLDVANSAHLEPDVSCLTPKY